MNGTKTVSSLTIFEENGDGPNRTNESNGTNKLEPPVGRISLIGLIGLIKNKKKLMAKS